VKGSAKGRAEERRKQEWVGLRCVGRRAAARAGEQKRGRRIRWGGSGGIEREGGA
jgi:hypothetical protein